MVAQVEVVLARKAEGRPITPEEYNLLGRFVNKVETGAEDQRQAEVDKAARPDCRSPRKESPNRLRHPAG